MLRLLTSKSNFLDDLMKMAAGDMPNCKFISHHWTKQVRHLESHFLLFVCEYRCGYMSSSRNSVAAHVSMQHPRDLVTIVHVDKETWVSLHQLIPGLVPTMPRLPLQIGDPPFRWSHSRARGEMSPIPGETSESTNEIQLAIEEVRDEVTGVQSHRNIGSDPEGHPTRNGFRGVPRTVGVLQIPKVYNQCCPP